MESEIAALRVILALLVLQCGGEVKIPREYLQADMSGYELQVDDTDPQAVIVRCKQDVELALCP